MTTLVVTPLPEERAHFMAALVEKGHVGIDTQFGPILATRFPDLDLLVAHGGHGKTQFGIHTRYLLDVVQGIDAVLCAGAAGALADYLAIGDVVIGTSTIEHDYQLKFVSRPLPSFPGNPGLLESFRAVSEGSDLPVHHGIVASGDEDVIETERGLELAAQTGAIVVAWEGAGAARAAMLTDVPHLEIRAVTDTANHTAPADFEINLGPAMANIARVILAWRSAR